ncbi:MAG: hypothetical protein AB1449_00935 [Chloroflexota bacterium]
MRVEGYFPDSCSTIAEVTRERSGSAVSVGITITRPAGLVCAPVLTPHTEVVRRGTFDQAGNFTLDVNGVILTFTVGEAAAAAVDGYQAQPVVPLETPDGAIGLTAPLGWAVEVKTGILRVAVDEASLTSTSQLIQGASFTLIVATGPGRAQDFGFDGRMVNEAYAYFVSTTGARVGAPARSAIPPTPVCKGIRAIQTWATPI